MRLTPTEQRILDLLADAQPHTHDEIMRLLDDGEYNAGVTVRCHVSSLRGKLVDHSLTVVATKSRRQSTTTYRLAMFLPAPLPAIS